MRRGISAGRWTVAGTALLVLAAGCSSGSDKPSAQDVANEFLKGVARNLSSAGQDTTNPTEATKAIQAAHTALKPVTVAANNVNVSVNNNSANVAYTLDWGFGPGRTWHDPSNFLMSQDKDGNWKVNWQPEIIAQKLKQGDKLKLTTDTQTQLPTVLGGDGSTLMAPTQVISVTLTPAQAGDIQQTASTLSAALSQFDPTITAQSIVTSAQGSSGSVTIVNLRQSDYLKVKSQIYSLPGVSFPSQVELLAPTKTFGSAILPTIRTYANAQAAKSAPLTVAIELPGDAPGDILYTTASTTTQPAPITTSLNTKLQTAAETALATVPQQAMALVIQPSTGKILAVAENAAASTAGDNPMTGLYPPGSTFKIVTASAAFNAGKLTPQQPIACPGTVTIEGKVIPNEGQFDLGTTPVLNAFAKSCNTTFSEVAAGLGPNDLPSTAKQFGIGVDYTIPNITTNTGKVTSDTDVLARAEDGFGQGKDQVSPFGMVMVAATAAHGSTPLPSLIAGQTTQSDTPPKPISSTTLTSLQTLMRAVVTQGTGEPLAHINPPVYGKTGTAQFGDGSQSHGWFVGYQGDMAFAFLVVDAGTSAVAVNVAGVFLNNAA
ncbi:MAG TPA: penicillin-binding transpeptidase domain-containing protein [Pseudonocardiaceae bacterium]|nr:penicillin-binding transpeptidase domain-containing protein [Pseudonocardiaceae bacterium]